MRDCPHTEIIRINAYCLDCGITHLISDFPKNPNKAVKATMNILGVIRSSSGSENDVVPIQVITRAQENAAKEKENENRKTDASSPTGRSNRNTWKARKERMKARRGRERENLARELKETQERLRAGTDKSVEEIPEIVSPPLERPGEGELKVVRICIG